jgi:hypothetical protein
MTQYNKMGNDCQPFFAVDYSVDFERQEVSPPREFTERCSTQFTKDHSKLLVTRYIHYSTIIALCQAKNAA